MKFSPPVLLLCFLFGSLNLFAQNKIFPQSFMGNWKGKIQWMVSGKPTQEFTMQLNVQPADSINQYSFQLIYGEPAVPLITENDRKYIIKLVDSATGHWVVDERNGILIDHYVHGNALHGAFTVKGSTIIDNYWLEDGKLYAEFFSIELTNKETSGYGTEESPPVDSYQVRSYQKAILTKVDEK